MKSRHIVTLVVFLIGAALLTGVYLKLKETQAAEADGEGGDESAAVDSARASASTTASTALLRSPCPSIPACAASTPSKGNAASSPGSSASSN
jgi:hypothetical protein